jgi:hypothetical protein
MRKLISALTLVCALGGCAGLEQERLQRQGARDDAACSYAPRDSQAYNSCRHDLVVAREQAAAQAPPPDIGGSMQQAGAFLAAGAASSPPLPDPQPMQFPQQTRCNYFRNQMVCQ